MRCLTCTRRPARSHRDRRCRWCGIPSWAGRDKDSPGCWDPADRHRDQTSNSSSRLCRMISRRYVCLLRAAALCPHRSVESRYDRAYRRIRLTNRFNLKGHEALLTNHQFSNVLFISGSTGRFEPTVSLKPYIDGVHMPGSALAPLQIAL